MTSSRRVESVVGVFRYSSRAVALVWQTDRALSLWLGVLSLACGLIPAGIAYVGKLIVDVVVAGANASGGEAARLVPVVVLELALVLALTAAQRGLDVSQSLLRALLGQRVNEMILDKALTLDLAAFENAEFYDRMTRARREASARPLSLVRRAFGLGQNVISLVAYALLLSQLSLWAVVVVVVAAVPAFLVETTFSADAFRLFRRRSPETRKQLYLETVLSREDHAKEVKLFQLGDLFLARYRQIFRDLFAADRSLTLRRGAWGFVLSAVSTLAFYGAYAWIALQALRSNITLGDMTMYLLVFKQAQSSVSSMLSAIGGMYEDNLYLSNLYEYLEYPSPITGVGEMRGPDPAAGIRFEDVSFVYPGVARNALSNITLQVLPGEKLALVGDNGAGKTTLIKLLTRLYVPTSGRITLDGLDLSRWDVTALRSRVSAIFQDFVRYQLLVGENIGAGDVDAFDDRARWKSAAKLGTADEVIEGLPEGYDTQLGQWFNKGQELSVGQWQKIALSRAFMRTQADIMVLDEPTASMDAEAEARVFEHFSQHNQGRMTIVISHRFSTVRMADQIVVLRNGAIVERGNHEALMAAGGDYQRLFQLQAAGYR